MDRIFLDIKDNPISVCQIFSQDSLPEINHLHMSRLPRSYRPVHSCRVLRLPFHNADDVHTEVSTYIIINIKSTIRRQLQSWGLMVRSKPVQGMGSRAIVSPVRFQGKRANRNPVDMACSYRIFLEELGVLESYQAPPKRVA